MKKLFYILAVAALAAGVVACQKVKEEDAFSTAPVAPELYAHGDILITDNTMDEDVTFTWSPYRFLPEGLDYTLYAAYGDASPAALYTTQELYYTEAKKNFRTLLYQKLSGLPDNDVFTLRFYVSVVNGDKEYRSPEVILSVYGNGDAAAPVVESVMEDTELDPNYPLDEISVLSWEPARLVYGEAITYDVFLSLFLEEGTKADEDDSEESDTPKKVKLTKEPIVGTELVITVDELNEAIVEAGGKEVADNYVVFEVVAYCQSLPNGVSSVSSNPAVITTYKATFAPTLLISGNIESTSIAQSSVTKGFYQGFVNLSTTDGTDAEILFCPSDDPEGVFGGKLVVSENASGDYAVVNGNVGAEEKAKVPAGWYYIELNQKLNTVSMVQFETLSLIGAAVGDYSWGEDVDLEYNAEKKQFSVVTELKAGEFKMRFNHNWNMSLGGSAEAGYTLSGGNIANEKEGEYKVVVDASKVPFVIKYVNTSFPEMLYVPGSHNGWSHAKTVLNGNGEGQYEGFANLGGEYGFKFTPAPNWDNGEWGFLKSSEPELDETSNTTTIQITDADAGNILEGSDVTYYKAVVDLANLNLKLTPVTTLGIIGGFIGNSWASDMYPMEYNADKDCWVAKEVEIIKGTEWKFRMNEAWDINLGGALDNLTQDGPNIVEADGGIYDVVLYINTAPYHAEITKTGESTFVDTTEGPWSLIGVGGDWETDIDMTKDGKVFVYKGLELTAGVGFKIRFDHEWAFNRGAVSDDETAIVPTGEAFEVVNNGANMAVSADGAYDIYYDSENETITIYEEGTVLSDTWSLIGVNGDRNTDINMVNVAPGIYVTSSPVKITEGGWKIRCNGGWDVNRGGTLTEEGVFAEAVPNGSDISLTGTFNVVYNANNETIGTLVWGVVGSVASISGFNWNYDIPMNLASDGKWYSLPITLSAGDEIKIRKYAAWDENFGGAFSAADTAFEAVANGSNIAAEGTYVVVYDPTAVTLTLSTNFWGIVGDFNSWGSDVFMLYDGENWIAYNQNISGFWKIREGAGWDNNRGGVFAEQGTAFEAVPNGANIDAGELTGFDVVYAPEAETITVK